MSFTARLSSDLVAAEAGGTVPLTVEVVSRAEERDRFEMEIEGLDPEWTAIPVPIFTVEPGETHSEKIFFKPPRASESLAGNYPFVLKVRSLESGESRIVQGVLQIKPYNHLSMEISPKKGYFTPAVKHNDYTVTIMNLGNTEHTLQLFGSDPEEECAFEFEHDQVTVGPGQQKEVALVVNPTSKRFMATSRLYGFSVTARNIENPSVAVSAQAQLEHRPFMTVWRLMFLIALGALAGLWLYLAPKPPAVQLSVDKPEVMVGEPVTVTWNAQNANRVVIKVNDRELRETTDLADTVTFTPEASGVYSFEAVATRENKVSVPERVEVRVDAPVPVPDPEILTFKADRASVRVGESVILSYKFGPGVTKAYLQPMNRDLPISGDQIEIPITSEGEKTFTLIAENKEGKATRKSVTVRANQGSQASIVVFRAEPAKLDSFGGVTKLIYQLSNAVRAEISDGTETRVLEPPTSGEREFLIDRTTTFTLTGFDSNGRTVTATVTVSVSPPPNPTPTTATGGGTTGQTTTTGSPTTTTGGGQR